MTYCDNRPVTSLSARCGLNIRTLLLLSAAALATLLLATQVVLAQVAAPPAGAAIGLSASRPAAPADQGVANNASQTATGIPDENTRYRMFFGFLANIEDFADKLSAEGKGDASLAWRTHVQRLAGLSDAENAALKSVAFDFNRLLADKNDALSSAITSARAQQLDASLQRVPIADDISQLEQSRILLTDTYLSQLKTQLGAESFKKLDAFVQDLYHSSTTIPIPKHATTAAAPPTPKATVSVGGAK